MTANDGPIIYPSNPSMGANVPGSAGKRQVVPQGQDPLGNMQNLQVFNPNVY